MIDHSVQLGKMYVLTGLGIRRGELPVGRPRTRQDMSVLAVLPTNSRRKKKSAINFRNWLSNSKTRWRSYVTLPANLTSVASLRDRVFKRILLSDVKHKIANLLKKYFASDERWKKFESQLGTTSAAIQQTELEHLMPSRKKLKWRFMSIDRLIDWGTRVTDYLKHNPSSPRLIENLGWLNEFTDDLKSWQQVRQMINEALRQANEQGVWIGASKQLREELMALPAEIQWVEQMSERLIERLIEIVATNESQSTFLSIKTVSPSQARPLLGEPWHLA